MRVACTQRDRTLARQGACALGTRELRSGPSISSEEPASWGGLSGLQVVEATLPHTMKLSPPCSVSS